MTESLNHKLDVSKIKTLIDVKNLFECMCLSSNASEEHENYELLKEYFTIPNDPQELKLELPRKSLEEILQEFDEKIDDLIERTKRNFYACKATAERKYENKFNQIFNNFEYAKENGQFPPSTVYVYCDGGNYSDPKITTSVDLSIGNRDGFYSVDNGNFQIYMKEKPTAVVRFFMNKLLGFRWVDN